MMGGRAVILFSRISSCRAENGCAGGGVPEVLTDSCSEPGPYLLFDGAREIDWPVEEMFGNLGWRSIWVGFKNQSELPAL